MDDRLVGRYRTRCLISYSLSVSVHHVRNYSPTLNETLFLTNESFLLTYVSTSLLFSIKKWYIFPWLKRVKEKGRLKKRVAGREV